MKPGRNDPCPCGSGRKYKQCCGVPGRAALGGVPQLLQSALASHQAGQLQQAEALYRQALAAAPANPDALHLLGVLCYQSGRLDAAVDLIGRALAANPAFPQASFNLAVALKALGRLEEAAAAYRRAIALKPDYAEAHDNLGNILKELGRDDEAVACYRQALAANPASAVAHNNLGIALKSLGRLDEAIESYQCAIAINAAYAEAHNNLGSALLATGREEEALPCFERAAALKPDLVEAHFTLGGIYAKLSRLQDAAISYQRVTDLQPDYPDAYYLLGCTLKELGRAEEAAASYRREIAHQPGHAGAHSDLGALLLDMKRTEEAAACFRRAIELQPDFAAAHHNLGIALYAQDCLDGAAASYRRAIVLDPDDVIAHNNLGNILLEQGRLEEAADIYRQADARAPALTDAYSNLLFSLNYLADLDADALYAAHREFGARHAAAETMPHGNDRDAARPLRIGYVSADFKRHSVSYFIEPLLQAHDRSRFSIYCYAVLAREDDVTARLQSHADAWRDITALDDAAAAAMIRADEIDILVDLSGHTGGNRLTLFAMKPAPVQVSWLGYPNTTGLAAIDYRITDARADPPGEADRLHSETLVRLPRTFLCYRPSPDSPPVKGLPAIASGHVTFGSFNNLSKVTPQVLALWARILAELPDARLLLKSKPLSDAALRERVLSRFAELGVDPGRVTLSGVLAAASDHLDLYNQIDIGLDPFPYNGTTTTCEALWMGVPVLTLAGDRHAGRVGDSLLGAVGLEELVAPDQQAYVDKAVALAGDLERLAALRAGLRPRMQQSPLCDETGYTRELEAAYRAMWERYANRSST
jgi:predicted O-linked N-acetylglucosamine transferase (SPINDLY family)